MNGFIPRLAQRLYWHSFFYKAPHSPRLAQQVRALSLLVLPVAARTSLPKQCDSNVDVSRSERRVSLPTRCTRVHGSYRTNDPRGGAMRQVRIRKRRNR